MTGKCVKYIFICTLQFNHKPNSSRKKTGSIKKKLKSVNLCILCTCLIKICYWSLFAALATKDVSRVSASPEDPRKDSRNFQRSRSRVPGADLVTLEYDERASKEEGKLCVFSRQNCPIDIEQIFRKIKRKKKITNLILGNSNTQQYIDTKAKRNILNCWKYYTSNLFLQFHQLRISK